MFYIHKYEVALQFGGPEEGGWWFTSGVPVEDHEPIEWLIEENAYAHCRMLNGAEHRRRKLEEDYDFSSVLAYRSTHYEFDVSNKPEPQAFPRERPHYE